jgi:hypothetical protein
VSHVDFQEQYCYQRITLGVGGMRETNLQPVNNEWELLKCTMVASVGSNSKH